MGIILAKAAVQIGADVSGLQRGLSAAKHEVNAAIRDIQAGASAVMGTFAAFGKGFLQQGLAAAGRLEQTTVQMETMIGSAEEAKKTLADLQRFAVKTPFEMPGILQVATQMIQFGERGEGLIETMEIIGDASGGTADKFQILGRVMNDIRGVGKLMTQDFRQLSTRGIISLQDIADHFKVTTNEANTMLSTGKISFEDFRNVLKGLTEEGGRYHKMSIKQSLTLIGMTSTLSDAWNILKMQMAQSLIPVVKQFTATLISALNWVDTLGDQFKASASAALVGATAFSSLGAAVMGTGVALRFLGISWTKFFIGGGLGLAITAIGAAVGLLTKKLSENEGIVKLVKEIYENLKTTWEDLSATWEEAMSNLKPLIEDTFKIAIDWVKQFLDWVSLMTTDWRLTWELMKTNTAIAFTIIADKALMMFNTIKAAAIGAGAGMVSAMKDSAYNIGLSFQIVVGAIKGLFKGLWAGIKSKFQGGSFLDSFKQAYEEERRKVEKNFKPVGANASKAFTKAFVDNMGNDSPLSGTLDELREQADRIRKQMKEAREIKRDDELINKFVVPINQEQKAPQQKAADAFKAELEAGRYGFAEAGQKIQDTLLKQKDDEQKKQTGLLEKGNEIQDKILKAVEKTGMKPAVLT